MTNEEDFWKEIIKNFKKEVLDRYVEKVIQEENTINRPGKDDTWYRYYVFYLKNIETPVKIIFSSDRAFSLFTCEPEKEIDKYELLNITNHLDKDEWIIKLVEEVKDIELLRKFKHAFAFLEIHNELEWAIKKAKAKQLAIIKHLSENNYQTLNLYSNLKKIMAGKTTNYSSRYYSSWDIYMEFDSVSFGSKDFLDEKNLEFNTYVNYNKLIERINAVSNGFSAFNEFQNGKNPNEIYGLNELKLPENE